MLTITEKCNIINQVDYGSEYFEFNAADVLCGSHFRHIIYTDDSVASAQRCP
jgi:hypothetical protein